MPFELFIALRYLVTRRKHSFISIISCFSVLGVALGVAALIVVLGVMNGFSSSLRDKILGVNADLIVSSAQGGLEEHERVRDRIVDIPGVAAVMPFIYSEVMLSTPRGVKGAGLRGINVSAARDVLSLENDLFLGSLAELQDREDPPGIILGKSLARQLGVALGDPVNMLSPSGKKSAAGFSPQVKIFQVAGLFDTGMYEYDSSLAYVSLAAARDILGYETDLVSGLEVKLQDVYAAGKVGQRLEKVLSGYPLVVRTWIEMNKSLFSALKLEKNAMGVILVMIVLVGSFSIITTLIMLVMEKKQDIAVLMAMGTWPRSIKRIFMWQGVIIGLVGTALGFGGGLLVCFLLERYQFIKLPGDVYPMDHLTVLLEPLDLWIIGLSAMLLCFLATLYPALQAAKIEPAEVLRYE
ncbi:MAG: lipoprotein-releasing ABC transporter permease subunit [Desulfohalobiaceae bacterium]|nr:lipoprotein-releasing ABC transporter permease subunit [Desulfohalobiaceae bacterium]